MRERAAAFVTAESLNLRLYARSCVHMALFFIAVRREKMKEAAKNGVRAAATTTTTRERYSMDVNSFRLDFTLKFITSCR